MARRRELLEFERGMIAGARRMVVRSFNIP
jgi:hypothetical protein